MYFKFVCDDFCYPCLIACARHSFLGCLNFWNIHTEDHCLTQAILIFDVLCIAGLRVIASPWEYGKVLRSLSDLDRLCTGSCDDFSYPCLTMLHARQIFLGCLMYILMRIICNFLPVSLCIFYFTFTSGSHIERTIVGNILIRVLLILFPNHFVVFLLLLE